MIQADDFLACAQGFGFTFYTGVPCSFLTPLINAVIAGPETHYVAAANEGEAVALAAGAWLGGRQAVVMCQNSGLGNMVNSLVSLNYPFRIPVLLICTWRGQPGLPDEPQHVLMGRITPGLIDLMEIEYAGFPSEPAMLLPTMERAVESMRSRDLPFALVMERGAVAAEKLRSSEPPAAQLYHYENRTVGGHRPTRFQALETMLDLVPESAAIIATTGKTGRELFTLADRAQHFYQVGSMGCASALGLGVALCVPLQVVVVDGDGAALMRLGNLATVGAAAPAGLLHVVLDNGVYDSTGGQPSASAGVDFAAVAVACGYRSGVLCDSLETFRGAFRAALAEPGPHLVHLRIRPGSLPELGRPTLTPEDVARRFRGFLCGAAPIP